MFGDALDWDFGPGVVLAMSRFIIADIGMSSCDMIIKTVSVYCCNQIQ